MKQDELVAILELGALTHPAVAPGILHEVKTHAKYGRFLMYGSEAYKNCLWDLLGDTLEHTPFGNLILRWDP